MTTLDRAYSLLNVKSFDDERRTFSGIASTPSIDRMGDIVDPLGAKFALPMALLLDHDSKQQVGHVEFAKPNKDGIPFKASIPIVTEPGKLKDLVDYAWDLVKYRLRSFVSIGFSALKYEIMKDGGYHFTAWEWLELSLVSIPAQSEAVVHEGKSLESAFLAFKSIDAPLLAATGKEPKASDRPTPPAPGKKKTTPIVKALEGKVMKKTVAEQISAFEAARQAKAAEMTTIMEATADSGETLDAETSEKYDTLADEVKSIDTHLARLKTLESTIVKAAVPVAGHRAAAGSESRGGHTVVQMKEVLPKGIGFVRLWGAQYLAKKHGVSAVEVIRSKGWGSDLESVAAAHADIVLRAAVTPGNTTDTTFAAPLVVQQNLASEFVDLLRPQTIIGRLGLRRVPFNISVPRQTGGASVAWVGEGAPKPVSSLAFDSISLRFTKVAGIVPITQELLRFSNPSAEAVIRDDLINAVAYITDRDFLDPSKAAVTNVSPASVTNGVTPVVATGTTADALRDDLGTLLKTYAAANMGVTGLTLVMTSQMAIAISLMVNALGQAEFPGMGPTGGTLVGIPVITSENIVATGGSPVDGGLIVALSAGDILLADDGGVSIDVSTEASIQMETAPDSPATASTTFVSAFQQNMAFFRAEREIHWLKRRSTAVQYIASAKYG